MFLKVKAMLIFFKLFVVSFLMSQHAYAFTCYLTMVKDSCWTNYNVSMTASNANTGEKLITVNAPKGQSWARSEFECQPGQTLSMTAQFSPVIWAGQENAVYPGQRYWLLPGKVENGITGWNLTICFPKWFAKVPVVPNSSGNCQCNTDNIPPVPPTKK